MLALLMIISSTGMTLAAHICKGELKEFTFFNQEKSCCAKQDVTPPPHCPAHANTSDEMPQDCCENLQISAEAPESAIKSLWLEKQQQDNDQLVPYFLPAYLIALLQPEIGAENTNFTEYPPPATVRDIPVLVQSFLL